MNKEKLLAWLEKQRELAIQNTVKAFPQEEGKFLVELQVINELVRIVKEEIK